MRVYVAGKTQAYREVQIYQRMATTTGHKITYDWTAVIEQYGGDFNEVQVEEKIKREQAEKDFYGVYYANLVIAVGHPALCGTLWECGMAVASNTALWLVGWERARHSVFESLPGVQEVDPADVMSRLWERSPKRLEREPPPPLGLSLAEAKLMATQSIKWSAQ